MSIFEFFMFILLSESSFVIVLPFKIELNSTIVISDTLFSLKRLVKTIYD